MFQWPTKFVLNLLLIALSLSSTALVQAQTNDLRQKALPALSQTAKLLTSNDYHKEPINLKHAKSNEKLVPLDDFNLAGESYYARTDKLNAPYYRSFASAPKKILLRSFAAKKLQEVNAKLAPLGLELFIYDAFRPVSCQKDLWQYFLKQAKLAVPKGSEAEQIAYAARYCSNPANYNHADPRTWPTHCTGGAIDLTLRRKATGELLYMGSIFDDDSEVSHTDYFETRTKPLSSSELEARGNRRLLYWVMKNSGFENYHYEWWHFDYGNQMWRMNKKASSQVSDEAFWGPAQ
jgi:D-alanyl-D-alanine dipeptidase